MTQGQPDASGKMEACPKCGQAEYYKVTPSGERLCAICGTNLKDRPTPSADADRVRAQLERQRAENAKLQRAILHPHEQINPAPKTYGMKKVAYGDEILAELPEGQYVKLEDYRELARHFLKRGAEIERLEAALATPAPSAEGWLDSPALMEALADVEHQRWAGWQSFVFGHCCSRIDGRVVILDEMVERWKRQITTPYAALSESEKESDRCEVRKTLAVLRSFHAPTIHRDTAAEGQVRVTEPAPTAAEDGLREALEAKIASLEASIKGKEAIIYGLLTKGTNQ